MWQPEGPKAGHTCWFYDDDDNDENYVVGDKCGSQETPKLAPPVGCSNCHSFYDDDDNDENYVVGDGNEYVSQEAPKLAPPVGG